MQQSDHFGQMELPSFTARAPKQGTKGYGQIDNRALQAKPQLAGLKLQDLAVHHHLLSLPDDWNHRHMASYLANHYGFSRRTAFRIIGRLCDAGLVSRIWCQKTNLETYQIFEVPCPGRPTGTDARKRHVVTSAKLGMPGRLRSPSMPRKHHGYLVVDDAGPAFSRPTRGVPHLSHLQRTEEDVLHSSEHPTPASGVGGSHYEFRESCNDGQIDQTARGAKRRKGRVSPAKPHNARQVKSKRTSRNTPKGSASQAPRFPRLTNLAINAGDYRATPDAEEFMANLTTRLKPARLALRDLPEEFTQPWIDALMANPILSVAQDVLGYATWGAKELRSFVNSLGQRIPIYDLLLCWIGMNGRWSEHTVWDMRQRLLRKRPTAPDCRRDPRFPDLFAEVHNWHRNVDGVRTALAEQCTKAVVELLDGVDLDDPETIQTHPMIWTAVLASPLAPEEFIDADVVALARQSLVPASRDELDEWVTARSERMLCRWNGRFCTGDIEVLVGRGICAVLQEWYEFPMVDASGRRGRGGNYAFFTEAREAAGVIID